MKKFIIIFGIMAVVGASAYGYLSYSKNQKDFSKYAYFSCENGINYKYYKLATDTGLTYYDDDGKVLAECAAWFGGPNCLETKELAGACVEVFK